MKIYITFGQIHIHKINHKTFDKDSVAVLDCKDHAQGREIAFNLFGDKFFTTYTDEPDIKYFPRGIIEVWLWMKLNLKTEIMLQIF